jgi:hypothetical protein
VVQILTTARRRTMRCGCGGRCVSCAAPIEHRRAPRDGGWPEKVAAVQTLGKGMMARARDLV